MSQGCQEAVGAGDGFRLTLLLDAGVVTFEDEMYTDATPFYDP